jgi:hypothetical protein
MSNIFDSTTSQDTTANQDGGNQSFVAQLVASKGETWNDPETIAKGKLEADAFIEQQKARIAELEAIASKEEYSKSLLDKLQSGPALSPAKVEDEGDKTKENTTLDVDSIKGLISQTLQESRKEETAALNIAKANEAMTKAHGNAASEVLKARASELGLSIEYLQSVAAQSPTAFLTLVGAETKQESSHSMETKVNTSSGFNESNVRNWAYYENMRRTNKGEYLRAATQNQMVKDRVALGGRWTN